ncbi:MAG: hypothetical protein WCL04_01510 [Verrucomicrobiota bacterium]
MKIIKFLILISAFALYFWACSPKIGAGAHRLSADGSHEILYITNDIAVTRSKDLYNLEKAKYQGSPDYIFQTGDYGISDYNYSKYKTGVVLIGMDAKRTCLFGRFYEIPGEEERWFLLVLAKHELKTFSDEASPGSRSHPILTSPGQA